MDGYAPNVFVSDEPFNFSWRDYLRKFTWDVDENYTWVAPEEPQDGYIDAGVSLLGEILITRAEVEDISWLDAAYLDELVAKWNLDYCHDPLTGSYRIRSAVPCITSLEA